MKRLLIAAFFALAAALSCVIPAQAVVTVGGASVPQTFFGLSTDTKPTQGAGNANQLQIGDTFIETDTGRTWRYSGQSAGWVQTSSSTPNGATVYAGSTIGSTILFSVPANRVWQGSITLQCLTTTASGGAQATAYASLVVSGTGATPSSINFFAYGTPPASASGASGTVAVGQLTIPSFTVAAGPSASVTFNAGNTGCTNGFVAATGVLIG